MKILKKLYLNNLFFFLLGGIIVLFVCAFIFPVLYNLVWILFAVLLTFLFLDILIQFSSKNGIQAARITPEKLSNGDENEIKITLKNKYSYPTTLKIIDEIPFQFQNRNFEITQKLKASASAQIYYPRSRANPFA